MDRVEKICRAAVDVLAAGRALTHRAVDAEAGLPVGSTSNVFRTKADLVDGVTSHLAEVDRAAVGALLDPDALTGGPPAWTSSAEVARALADFAERTSSDLRSAALARFALLASTAGRSAIVTARAGLAHAASDALRAQGHHDPEQAVRAVLALLDGITLSALLLDQPLHPRTTERALLAVITASDPTTGRSATSDAAERG